MFNVLILLIVTATVHAASPRPTISTVQVGQLEAEYRNATNAIDKTRILNTLRESGFAHIAHHLTQNKDDFVIEPRNMRVKRPAMPVKHTGYEIEDGAASLQALFQEEPGVIQSSPAQQKELTYQNQPKVKQEQHKQEESKIIQLSPEQQKIEQQQQKEFAYKRQREIEQQRHKEEQQKEAALKAANKEREEKNMFEQLLASLTKDVNKEGRGIQRMGITMQWIDKHIGEITRSDLAQEDKERLLGEFNGIKDLLAQKITAAAVVK